MKTKIAWLVCIVGVALLGTGCGCSRIDPGYVGIKVNMAGSDKGVDDYPTQTGWVFYNPVTTKVYEYPTFQQSVVWQVNGGTHADESISFNCKGGAALTADVSLSGNFIGTNVPFIFVKFRSDPETIIHTYLRNEVRDALGRVGSTFDPMDVIGDKRAQFLDAVKKEVFAKVGDWFHIDYITFANKLRMDEKIERSINNIIEQKQQTITAELKVLQSKAEADQAAAKADGEKRVKIANAEAEAASIRLKAESQADANRKINESLSEKVLQSIALDKWNGILPTVTSGAVPFINVAPSTK